MYLTHIRSTALHIWRIHIRIDGAEDGRYVASSVTTLHYFVWSQLFLFFTLGVVSLITYNIQTLLDIGSYIASHRKPDFEFFNTDVLFTDMASEPFVWNAQPHKHKWKRGRRAGILVRLKALSHMTKWMNSCVCVCVCVCPNFRS